MKESYRENLASCSGLKPYAGDGDIAGVASARGNAGQPLSSEITTAVCRSCPVKEKAPSSLPFWQGIESFWNKIQDELPGSVWSHYEKYRQILLVLGTPAKSYEKQHGILATLNRAILEHRIVEIDYQPIGKPTATRRRLSGGIPASSSLNAQ